MGGGGGGGGGRKGKGGCAGGGAAAMGGGTPCGELGFGASDKNPRRVLEKAIMNSDSISSGETGIFLRIKTVALKFFDPVSVFASFFSIFRINGNFSYSARSFSDALFRSKL